MRSETTSKSELGTTDGVIHSHNLPPTLVMPGRTPADQGGPLQSRVEALERDLITDALKRSNGNAAAAARELGITSRMVRYKIDNLGIDYETLFNSVLPGEVNKSRPDRFTSNSVRTP